MAGLWQNNEATPEGKYPVLLRRDGTIPEWPYFVIGARDPVAPYALRAYAAEAKRLGMDLKYVLDVEALAGEFERFPRKMHDVDPGPPDCGCREAGCPHVNPFARRKEQNGHGDPDKPPHREDDPLTLALARGETTMAVLASATARADAAEARAKALAAEVELLDPSVCPACSGSGESGPDVSCSSCATREQHAPHVLYKLRARAKAAEEACAAKDEALEYALKHAGGALSSAQYHSIRAALALTPAALRAGKEAGKEARS